MTPRNCLFLICVLLFSLEGKSQWKRVLSIPDSVFIRVPEQQNGKLYGGNNGCYYTSTDQGISWQRVTNDSIPQSFFILDFYKFEKYLFAYGDKGIFRSTDSGITWNKMSNVSCFNMFSIGNVLVFKNNSNNYRSVDSGKTWIHIGGGCGTYFYNFDSKALTYPYTKYKDSLLFLDCGVFGASVSSDSAKSYSMFGLSGNGPQDAITQIDGKLFLAAYELFDTTNIYTTGIYNPAWTKIVTNVKKEIIFLGNNGKTLFGTTKQFPYYSNNYSKNNFTWKMMDTIGLYLDTFFSNTNYYYDIPYVKNIDTTIFLAVRIYKTVGPNYAIKHLYYSNGLNKIVIPDTPISVNVTPYDNCLFSVNNKIGTCDFTIVIGKTIDKKARLSVYDIFGRKILSKEYSIESSTMTDNISLQGLPSGMYLFALEGNSRKQVQKGIISY